MQAHLSQLALLLTKLAESYEERGYDSMRIDDMDLYWSVQPSE
jgi:hypothetical protein